MTDYEILMIVFTVLSLVCKLLIKLFAKDK